MGTVATLLSYIMSNMGIHKHNQMYFVLKYHIKYIVKQFCIPLLSRSHLELCLAEF